MLSRFLLVVSLAAVLLLPVSAGAGTAQNPVLKGRVGPDFTIALTNADGTRVQHLDPGTYQIDVDDRSEEHNFHLRGTGVDVFTDVEFVGTMSWTVTFTDAVYRYQCDPHADLMKGSFTVGNPPPPPPPPPKPTRLLASVGPGAAIALRTTGGARATRVKAGRFVIAVTDRTRADNFHLTGRGVNRRTGVAFMGKATWRLTLGRGTYRYRSDAHPKRSGSVIVT